MNEKRSAICQLTFYELPDVSINSVIGSANVELTTSAVGIQLSVVGATLSEIRSSMGNFVDVELSARITDTSSLSESNLLLATYRYGVIVLKYTDGSSKLLGTIQSPILITYEKSGIPAAFVLSVKGSQPEFAKFIT